MEEIHTEEQFEDDLMSSGQVVDAQNQLEQLYSTADELKDNLSVILGESRTTLDSILARENMGGGKGPKRDFDMSQVKVNPRLLEQVDMAHRIVDNLTAKAKDNNELNYQFI